MLTAPERICAVTGILFALVTGGCRKAPEAATLPEPTPVSLAQSWPATRTTDRGSFKVEIKPVGAAIPNNQHFSLDLLVTAVGGAAVAKPLSVAVDADMPSHGHGMNTTPETRLVDGQRYRTDGMLFHMGGDWVIAVDVATAGGKERALFPVTVE